MLDANDQAFTSALDKLKSHFDQDDVHGIWVQLNDLVWYHAAFLISNESRFVAAENDLQTSAFNGLIGNLIDQGWLTVMTTRIRKLQEKRPANRKNDVISLRSAIETLEKHQGIFTRARYRAYFLRVPNARIEDIEANFDILSKKPQSSRHDEDKIDLDYLGELSSLLDTAAIAETVWFVNKFIAHSATVYSRSTPIGTGLLARESVTIQQIEECIEALYKVAWRIYVHVLQGADHVLPPTPPYDVFAHLEHAWMPDTMRERLESKWQEMERWLDNVRTSNFKKR